MEHTIAAVATGSVRCAVGIIRLSGEDAIPCAARVFRPADGSRFGAGEPGKLVYGTLLDREGRPLDRVLATFSRAPRSYTGEDTAELHCHGSPTVLDLALEALFAQGVRPAQPGEFTRRAFLNGKMDLLQAEAVADLIDAPTPQAARAAQGQLEGTLSRRVDDVYHTLVELLAHFHATLDYPDEDLDPFTGEELEQALDRAAAGLRALLESYGRGRFLRDGVPTAIVGRPNVGKSSILNALVGFDRAIVTHIPGTTRDTVEERCVLGEVLLRLTDTAGLRDTEDPVEKLGVERSRAAMEAAGLILVVLDRSAPAEPEDRELVREATVLAPTIVILNKQDLPPKLDWAPPGVPVCPLCARTGEGLDRLGELVAQLFPQGAQGEVFLTNPRQGEAAARALEAVERARRAGGEGVPPDLLLTDVEEALGALAELTGRRVREDIVDRIFSRFCVGK